MPPVTEITIVNVWVHGADVGTCEFGVVSDSSLFSFPGTGVSCGRTYEWWASQRRPSPPAFRKRVGP